MKIGVTVIVCSLLYILMVAIIYFSKKRVNNMENKVYSILLKLSIFGLILELLCCYFVYYMDYSKLYGFINVFVNKLYIIYLLAWEFIFTGYVFFISFNDNKKFNDKLLKNKNKIMVGIVSFFLLLMLLTIFLPLYYFNDGNYVYSYGPGTDLLTLVGGICIGIDIFCVIKNIKNIRSKKYYPLFSLILLMIVVLVIRELNPGIILINSTFAFVTMFMYHTIENPDVLLIEELYKNKTLVEETNEEKANFLFNMSQEVRNHVGIINEFASDALLDDDISLIKEKIRYINANSRELDFIVNHILDVSAIDAQNIKVMNSKYNIYNLLDEIRVRGMQDIKKDVDFRYNVSKGIPKYLYGDSLKLKQVLITIVSNAVKSTKTGFIELNVNSIIKYGVCRLIITVEDSGRGMSLEEINDVLKADKEIAEEDIAKLKDLDFVTCKKIISLLGGNLMLMSDEEKGTRVSITLDQKVVIDKEKEKQLNDYKQLVTINKKILVVDDNAGELKKIKDFLNDYDYNVHTTMYEKDCLEKLNESKYDLLIIDDDLVDGSALDVFQKIKGTKKIGMKVVVMLDEKKLSIKEHYLKDGFNDTIEKNKLLDELKRIIEKY